MKPKALQDLSTPFFIKVDELRTFIHWQEGWVATETELKKP